jgi:hypothetical protein
VSVLGGWVGVPEAGGRRDNAVVGKVTIVRTTSSCIMLAGDGYLALNLPRACNGRTVSLIPCTHNSYRENKYCEIVWFRNDT